MQIRVTDQPAFILHRKDWQNSSLLLDLLTRDFGRVSVLAKSGKKSRSRGLFQPFSKLSVGWAGRQTLKTLTAIDSVPKDIPESLYLPLLYINELVEAFQPGFESSTEIFALYEDLLNQIKTENIEACLREFERTSMQVFGYLPDLYSDCKQGNPVSPECCYRFLASQGLTPCECDDDNAVDGKTILLWNQRDYTDAKVVHTAKTIMRCIIDFNLQGKRLKSRDIYLQMKNWV
ncbi:MAG: DNA repair protein RecO [Gammaproteobacteria bacterium]|nr:DNA repair protein RecO [Gammaproteobacteria bacterium]